MFEFYHWVVLHWEDLVVISGLIHALISAIVALTTTPENEAKMRKILEFISFLKPRDVEGVMKVPFTRLKDGDLRLKDENKNSAN